ncbi:MAG: hypothetical protein ABSA93_18055 [Streptosporangiaceae bacterium]|jgi:hypothetical protein
MIGVRGGSVLAIVGIVGVYCASTGWSNRDAGLPAPAPSAAAGESLSSSDYASDAYLVWPGTPSAAARRAESGLVIKVSRAAGGIDVSVTSSGRSDGARYYQDGARVYVIYTSSGGQSLLVTDSKGSIVS